MTARAGIVVTGTEVLTGRVTDRNGPWLAEQLRRLGVDVGHVVLVGDRPEDMRGALDFLAGTGVALVITSGGLGPTADDLTAEVVGRFHGRASAVDPVLEQRIAAIVERLMARRGWRADPEATAAGVRKQALVPSGATVLDPVGTAPGLVVPPLEGRAGPTVLVLPGPPAELQGMWAAAVATEPVRRVLAGAAELRQETVRLWGTLEAQLAVVLRDHDAELAGLEVTTCMRDGELEIVTRFAPDAAARLRPARGAARGDLRLDALLDRPDPGRDRGHGLRRPRAHRRHGRVLHRRAAGRAADRAARFVGLGAGRRRPPTRTRPRSSCSASRPTSSPSTARSAPRWRSPSPRVRGRGSAPMSASGSPGSPARAGGRRRSRSGRCTSASPARTASELRALRLPGTRSAVRERSVTMAMHLLRVLLVGGPPA